MTRKALLGAILLLLPVLAQGQVKLLRYPSYSKGRVAFSYLGDIWTASDNGADVQRITDHKARDVNPRFSPDGTMIAFVSDRTGREEVYISDELGKTVKKLSDVNCDKSAILWGADSKFLLWNGSDHKLRRVEIESGKTDVAAAGEFGNVSGPQISPDGKLLMYSKDDKQLHSHIYSKPMDGGEERAIISDQFLLARGAKWTPDGKKIVFIAGFGAPSMASTNLTTVSLWSVALTRIDKDPDEGRDVNTEAQAETAPADTAQGGRGGRAGAGAGAAPAAAPSAATGPAPRRISFTVRMEVDLEAERKQVFEEAWRVMKNRFYDPKMNGVDWARAKDTYEALLPYIADTEELQNVIMEMIGEMNASHTGISGGGGFPGQATNIERVATRYPGFDLEPDASGYYKVSYIYKKGPADKDFIKLAVGDFVLSVNGKDLRTTDNYWRLFNVLPGRKLEFVVNSKPAADGAWKFSVDPLTATQEANLEYDNWVDNRTEMVRKLSNGQIGYLHIKAMDQPSLEKFQRDLLVNQDKKGLIIDQRFNGGGGIDKELLGILAQRKQYQYTVNRDSVPAPRPGQTFFGPMVVLENERSASDAEMFPQGFRDLGLGKVVGVTTYGAVIGAGSFRLLDGSTIRTPGSGVYTASGQNLENYGVPPDVYIDNTPADYLAGHDRQIEKAIEVLTGQMK